MRWQHFGPGSSGMPSSAQACVIIYFIIYCSGYDAGITSLERSAKKQMSVPDRDAASEVKLDFEQSEVWEMDENQRAAHSALPTPERSEADVPNAQAHTGMLDRQAMFPGQTRVTDSEP
jgi:hypothetical protein